MGQDALGEFMECRWVLTTRTTAAIHVFDHRYHSCATEEMQVDHFNEANTRPEYHVWFHMERRTTPHCRGKTVVHGEVAEGQKSTGRPTRRETQEEEKAKCKDQSGIGSREGGTRHEIGDGGQLREEEGTIACTRLGLY